MRLSKTVLLVEDEVLVAYSLREALTAAGFEVHWVPDGGTAIAKGSELDLFAAIVDIGLPDFSGEIVARKLRARSRTLPIILATGCDSVLVDRIAGELGLQVLMKPFRESKLVEMLGGSPVKRATNHPI